jgi:NAD(P)H-flavin reductase
MSCNPHPYLPIRATVEDVITETSNIKTFVIRPEKPVLFRAGQFVELGVPGIGEAPFTPSSSPAVTERFETTIMRVGRVTERLHGMKPPFEVGVRGPLGKPYPLDQFYGREVLIVGGGVGLAPLRALLFALFEESSKFKRIIVRYGSRTPSDIVYRKAVAEAWGRAQMLDIQLTVDKRDATWTGNEGVVTTILEKAKLTVDAASAVAIVCGPPIMMKFVTRKVLELGFAPNRIYLSMEKNMSCGIGKCGHCRLGPYYACKDGPVFTYEQVKDLPKIWD